MENETKSKRAPVKSNKKTYSDLVYRITKSEKLWLNELVTILKENRRVDYREIWSRLEGKISEKFLPKAMDFHLVNATGEQITLLGMVALQGNLKFLRLCDKVIKATWQIIKAEPKIQTIATSAISEKSGVASFETGLILNVIYLYGRFWGRADYNENGFTIKAIHITTEESIFYQYKRFTKIEDGIIELLEREKKDKVFLSTPTASPKQVPNNSALNNYFVEDSRLDELRSINDPRFDFKKLIRLCEEINDNYCRGNYYSTAMIGRAILDHVPPIFKLKSFDQVASNYGGPNASKSFKKNMSHLNNSFKQIAHAHLHTAMREKEVLPNETQVNFKQDMDVLLCEIIRLSK